MSTSFLHCGGLRLVPDFSTTAADDEHGNESGCLRILRFFAPPRRAVATEAIGEVNR